MGRYTRKNSTGDAGEYLVGYVFAGKLGWAYRILDSDTGIDGEAEVYEHTEPTGRLLKVQVKSTAQVGDADEAVEERPGGFKLSVKKTDVTYWRLLALPVVLCVARLQDAKVYYRIIDDTVDIPDNNNATFGVSIPIANELNEAAREPLSEAATRTYDPLERLLSQVQIKLEKFKTENGAKYAGDNGESMAQLKRYQSRLITSIRMLVEVSGYVLTKESQARIDRLAIDLNREVQRLDHELTDWDCN